MTSITWAGPRYVQELGTFLGPENRTQRRCEMSLLQFCQFYVITQKSSCQESYTSIIITSITWADLRCVQEAASILGPQNRKIIAFFWR